MAMVKTFSLPKGMAKLATPTIVKEWKAEQERKARELAEELERFKREQVLLEKGKVTITKKLAPCGD